MKPGFQPRDAASGTVFYIQSYALHDGPGIRTTVFLKGCPLRCWWCHNPESLSPQRELLFLADRCLSCGSCQAVCPTAVKSGRKNPGDKMMHIPPAGMECTLCNSCADSCPAEALEMMGREMTAPEVMEVLEKDAVFYEESGGGVTFSGGEPLMQGDFLRELLLQCRQRGWHTAVDTCGYAPGHVLESILPFCDLFLYDLKHLDEKKHREFTGVSNELILENLERLLKGNKKVFIRFPVIPGINDQPDHLHRLGRYLQQRGLKQLYLLPYHAIGAGKYARHGMAYFLPELKSPTPEQMKEIEELLASYPLNVVQGG